MAWARYEVLANHPSGCEVVMDQRGLLIRVVQEPESAAMHFEAKHRAKATCKLSASPGGRTTNYFPFAHAPEIKVSALGTIGNALGDEVAFGNGERLAAV